MAKKNVKQPVHTSADDSYVRQPLRRIFEYLIFALLIVVTSLIGLIYWDLKTDLTNGLDLIRSSEIAALDDDAKSMEARLLERLDKLEENLGKGFTDRFGLLDAEDDDIERRLNFTMAALTEKVDKSVKDIVRIDSSVNILSSSSLMVSQSAKDALAGFSEMSKKLFGFDTAAEALEKRIDEKFLSVREADCRDYARQQKRPFRDLAAELSERDVSEVTKKLASNIASSVETAGNIFFSRNCGKLYIIVDGKLPTNQAGFVTRLAEHLDGEEL